MPPLTAASASALAASLNWRMLFTRVNLIFHKVEDSADAFEAIIYRLLKKEKGKGKYITNVVYI